MPNLDFPSLAARLLTRAESLLAEWFPNGHRQGNEYVLGNIQGDAGSSLSINVTTGAWADFSAGLRGGDLTSLYAAKLGIQNGQAYRVLIADHPVNGNGTHAPAGTVKRKRAPSQQVPPVPSDAPPCPRLDQKLGTPVRVFAYRTTEGQLWGYMARYEPTPETAEHFHGRNKLYKPWTWDGKRWTMGGWRNPRPLYGLDDLATRPAAPVLIVEGESAADAARQLVPQYVVMTWQGGANGADYAEWGPLYGRSVVLWPDADAPGIAACWRIARLLTPVCPQVKLISPDGHPDGWDAADFVAGAPEAGWEQFKEWAKPRLSVVTQADIDAHFAAAVATVTAVATPPQEEGTPAADAPPDTDSAGRKKVNWYVWKLDCNGAGEPLANLNNAVTVLERDSPLSGLVWYDEFLNRILTPVPGGRPREWTDADDINLALDLQRRLGCTKMAIETVSKAVVAIAMRNVKNCVRDWIDGLEWDGVPRIDSFFEDHFGSERSAYTTAASKNFWLSMLARVYRPGCKVDNVIVLEGLKEGEGKSTVLQIVGGEWYTEQHESAMNPKAFFEVIQGVLITEIGEMDSFARAEQTRVKAIITSRFDKYRDAYGRYATRHLRQGIFVCTTNEDNWNKSPSGGRRWWPIRCEQIDLSAVAASREQYFAEARTRLAPTSGWNEKLWRFNAGEDWWIMPSADTKAEQHARYESDIWTPVIDGYIRIKTYVTVAEILELGLNIKPQEMSKSHEFRVANVLKYLGWTRNQERVDGRIVRLWRPPE